MEVEFHQSDLQDKQSCYQTCRTTITESREPPTFGSLGVTLDHQHLVQAPPLFCFDVPSQPAVLFHEDTIVTSNYCLRETFYLLKSRGSKGTLATIKEVIC